MVTFTDEELIEGIRGRKGEVFKYLGKRYKRGIRLLIYELGGNSDDGDDMFGEGIVGIIEMVSRPDFKLTSKLSTLFFAICRKQWLRVLDRQKAARNYKTRYDEPTESEDFSEDLDQLVYERVFSECFKSLDKICRQILNGYFKEIPLKPLAELLEMTYNTLRKKKSICHASLMQRINDHQEYKKIRDELDLDIDLNI